MEVLHHPAPAGGGGHALLACRARLSLCREIVASGGCGRTASLCCHPLVAGGGVWGPWRDILVMLALDYCSSAHLLTSFPNLQSEWLIQKKRPLWPSVLSDYITSNLKMPPWPQALPYRLQVHAGVHIPRILVPQEGSQGTRAQPPRCGRC